MRLLHLFPALLFIAATACNREQPKIPEPEISEYGPAKEAEGQFEGTKRTEYCFYSGSDTIGGCFDTVDVEHIETYYWRNNILTFEGEWGYFILSSESTFYTFEHESDHLSRIEYYPQNDSTYIDIWRFTDTYGGGAYGGEPSIRYEYFLTRKN